MRLSPQEGMELLKKFTDERTPIKAVFVPRFGPVTASVVGKLFWGPPDTPDTLWVRGDDKESAISFSLSGCIYEYGESREAPEPIRERSQARFESAFTVLFPRHDLPSGYPAKVMERVYLMELKEK